MTIEEHVSGEIQFYNHNTNLWETYANGILNDSNVLSVSTKNQCCEDGKFTIGGAFAGSLNLVCRLPGMTRYRLENARIVLRSWYGNDPTKARSRGIFWAMQVTRIRDIFTIRGMDAMGWTDVLSPSADEPVVVPYFARRIVASGVQATLNYWFPAFFTEAMNPVLEDKTGIPSLLEYAEYSAPENCGILYANHYYMSSMWVEDTSSVAMYGMENVDDSRKTEKPRDVLRWIAEATGGFITVDGDGKFQMRQFCQPSLGIAEVQDGETEEDSLEIADYYLYPKTVYLKAVYESSGDKITKKYTQTDIYDEPEFSGFDIMIDGNAIINGIEHSIPSVLDGIFYAFARYEDVDVVNGENVLVPSGGDPALHTAKYKAYPVPFRCKVHKPAFFELGQTVIFPDHPNPFNNARYGYTAHVPYLRSVITSISWTFKGGTELACGAGECRSMLSLSQNSKADEVRRELRNRTE
jgi:hypothetical protein